MALALALDNPTYALDAKRRAAADMVEDLIAFLDDTDGDCDIEATGDELDCSWAEQFTGRATPGGTCEDDEDGADTEHSLGSLDSRPFAETFGFMRVKPYWMTDEEFQASRRLETRPVCEGNQFNWSSGNGGDLEDEHDGTEPDHEDGGSWSEAASMVGKTDGANGEDAEPSLGMPEQINQALRNETHSILLLEDGEEDAGDMPEATNEDGGDILDEPHDALDEGNDEGSFDDVGPWNAMTAEDKSAVAIECARLLGRLPKPQGPEYQAWFTGPNGSSYRFYRVA